MFGFVDDIFLNIEMRNVDLKSFGLQLLINKASAAVGVVSTVFARHGFSMNCKKGKTEAMLHYTTKVKEARALVKATEIVDVPEAITLL